MFKLFYLFIFTLISFTSERIQLPTNRTKIIPYWPNSTIPTLHDKNFDKIIKRGKVKPFLLLFSVQRCAICNEVLHFFENITEIIHKEYNSDIQFGKVDCFNSSWTVLRFNIDRIPKILYIENDTVSYMNANLTNENVFEFLRDVNKKVFPFPKPMTYFSIILKIIDTLNETITKYLESKGLMWNKVLTVSLIIGFILLVAYVQTKFMNYCCKSKKDNSTKRRHKVSENKYKKEHVHGKNCNHAHQE